MTRPSATPPLLLAMGLLAVLAAACGGSTPAPPPAPAKAAVAKPPPPAEAAVPSAPGYVYNPVGKRDPFRSPEAEPAAQAALANTACTEPLCRFDVDQLTLVAVVSGDANPWPWSRTPRAAATSSAATPAWGGRGGRSRRS
jgi:type IV pilus assembly protein PilP